MTSQLLLNPILNEDMCSEQNWNMYFLWLNYLPILLAEVWYLSAKYCDSAGKIYQGLAGNSVCWQDKWLTGTYMCITMQRNKLVSFIHVYTLPGEDEQSVVKVNAIEIKFHSLVIWWSLNKLWYLTTDYVPTRMTLAFKKLSITGYYKAAYKHFPNSCQMQSIGMIMKTNWQACSRVEERYCDGM